MSAMFVMPLLIVGISILIGIAGAKLHGWLAKRFGHTPALIAVFSLVVIVMLVFSMPLLSYLISLLK